MYGGDNFLLELFYRQVDSGHLTRAGALLELLSLFLASDEAAALRAELADPAANAPIADARKHELRTLVRRRRIDYLVHFTRAANVRSILDNGLLPRSELQAALGDQPGAFAITDKVRHDGRLNASCLSIGFPNYRMFYRYQKLYSQQLWAVLLIKRAVLWQLDCAFYPTNASSDSVRLTPLTKLKSTDAFADLFTEYKEGDHSVKRSDLALRDGWPTNPQAEVLVFDTIAAQDIMAVCLEKRDESYALCAASWPDIRVRIKPSFFAPRKDYAYWRA